MHRNTFTDITDHWGRKLWEYWEIHRKAAHEEEISIALKAKDIDHDGYPLIAVTADGGWFTRCNRGHTYKSKTGCQVIRGIATKKVLWVSVKNSFCAYCYYHHKRSTCVPEHVCYQNFKGPPQGMEQQGIVEGFLAGYEDFEVKYSVLVADGDSSTFPNLVKECFWPMKKCHCCNHFHKCCRTRLEKAIQTQEFTKLKWHLDFPSELIVKLCKSLKAACRMARVTDNKVMAERHLRYDLKNAVWHVLGYHDECRLAFCGVACQLHPDEPAPLERVDFLLPADQIGKLGTSVLTFLEAKWEEQDGSLDSCTCDDEGNCICKFAFDDNDDDEDYTEILSGRVD